MARPKAAETMRRAAVGSPSKSANRAVVITAIRGEMMKSEGWSKLDLLSIRERRKVGHGACPLGARASIRYMAALQGCGGDFCLERVFSPGFPNVNMPTGLLTFSRTRPEIVPTSCGANHDRREFVTCFKPPLVKCRLVFQVSWCKCVQIENRRPLSGHHRKIRGAIKILHSSIEHGASWNRAWYSLYPDPLLFLGCAGFGSVITKSIKRSTVYGVLLWIWSQTASKYPTNESWFCTRRTCSSVLIK